MSATLPWPLVRLMEVAGSSAFAFKIHWCEIPAACAFVWLLVRHMRLVWYMCYVLVMTYVASRVSVLIRNVQVWREPCYRHNFARTRSEGIKRFAPGIRAHALAVSCPPSSTAEGRGQGHY